MKEDDQIDGPYQCSDRSSHCACPGLVPRVAYPTVGALALSAWCEYVHRDELDCSAKRAQARI